MKIRYCDLIDQTFDFPQYGFEVKNGELYFHGIRMLDVVEKHGLPLRLTYLPNISTNINRSYEWFSDARKKLDYKGDYTYLYCTKSCHFSFVLEEVLKNKVHLETSSSYDLDIIENLFRKGLIKNTDHILCNGFKNEDYLEKIGNLSNLGFDGLMSGIDSPRELENLAEVINGKVNIGIRIATEEEPKFPFYTSRLGIGYKDILPLYHKYIENEPRYNLRMLHFFVNVGIRDTAYYWNELNKCVQVYIKLKKVCPSLDTLNIGGGFPVPNSLSFEYDYAYMIEEILGQVKSHCNEAGVEEPNIMTEFGSFTVGEAGMHLFEVVDQKKQNDRERWNLIDGSFMTTLPDTWAINSRFIMLPINQWNEPYERVLLGGITCDSDDYYNSEQHVNAIYLPKFDRDEPLIIGFFNTGAYQDTISGYGGLKHCLIPAPKHVVLNRDAEGNLTDYAFAEEQSAASMLKILGYQNLKE